MLDWLIGHALSGLYSLLVKTVFKPMIWSGQQIRCAREDVRAMDIRLHNATVQSPGATPTEEFLQHRRKKLSTIWLHAAFWLVVLFIAVIWFRSTPLPICSLFAAVIVVIRYFNVDVTGMPTRIEQQRK
jgi:hypothetical protein